MLTGPLSPWPNFTQEEADAVRDVLLSNKVNYWTGNIGRQFENEFAEFSGTKHAIALANGTVALDLIYHGLSIGSHNGGNDTDEVIVTSRTFLASVSSIINAGARPVFVDVDINSQNMDSRAVSQAITKHTRAVLCVHLAGWPCDIDAIHGAINGRDIKLIEDCAQAHGAIYRSKPVGSLGDAAAWSFCQDKIMTTGGEGGMVTCDDENLWRRMWAFKDHGKSYEAVYERNHKTGFRWLHESFGTNWRLTEMQSAIGRIQLRRMPEWTNAREKNATALSDALLPFSDENGIIRMPDLTCRQCKSKNEKCCQHAWYKFYAFVRPENLPDGWTRDRLVDEFNSRGLPCYQGSCSEVYLEKAFNGTDFRPSNDLPNARELGETSLMFLVHPTLSKAEIEMSQNVISEVLSSVSATKYS